MSQDRRDYQKKIEDGMFSRNIRADILDEFDLQDLLADQIFSQMKNIPAGESRTIDFNQLLDDVPEDEFDIDEVKEEFKNLITDIASDVREALVLASGVGKVNYVEDATWNPLLTYDRAGTCPSCGESLSLNHRISNNKLLVGKVTKMFNEAIKSLPNEWHQKNSGKKLFKRSDKNEQVVENGKRESIKKIKLDWDLFRDALANSGIQFNQKSGKMKRKEMLALNNINSDWGKIAAGLRLCDRRSLKCPHKACQENLWNKNLDTHSPFHKISYEATRIILETTISRPTARAPLSMKGYSGDQEISLRMGKIGDDFSRDSKKLIAEAVLSATTVLGDISIEADSEISFNQSALSDVSISQSDSERAAKVYTTPNHNIVTKLAKVIERIRPVEAFVLDSKKVQDHKKESAKCAAQILHAIHHSGVLFKVEKTANWAYSAKQTSNHATNLITLNSDIQNKITSDLFVKPSQDGEMMYNQLESMLSKETTPPMVCEPRPRTLDENQPGGMLTKAGQNHYPLVTQAPQYDHFGQNRFSPSEEAIHSINVLQSTEWAVNREMVDIAKGTIKNHVKTEILSKLKIRKAWQIRRHYFQDAEGTPILMANGEAKILATKKEFSTLEEAESYMSSDDTSSSTCSQEKQNRMKYDHWSEQIHEVFYIDFDGVKPAVTFGQVNAWWNTFDFIERLKKNYQDTKFWHSWHFDWRGRIMPISTMLSPQNDDFARGLITFANPEQLTESGRKWVGRVIAGMYKGQPIPSNFQGKDKENLEALMAKLESKTYEAYDEVSSHELFHQMMRVIAADPEANFASWGKDDVFRAKAEGLQRLALTKEFVSILDQGEKASTRLPINLDASSSIYQHASALMLDPLMASKVNVLPNESNKPSDVYIEVVEHLRSVWTENPFKSFEVNRNFQNSEGKWQKVTHIVDGLDDEVAESLKQKVLVRNMAKKPIMTIGYGASPQSMVGALLTDNQEDNGNHGGVKPYHLGENWPKVVEDPDELEKREYRYLITAHPSSTLGKICNELNIPGHFHALIAQKVIDGFTKSIEEVLPGYKKMKNSLKNLCKQNLEKQFETRAEIKAKWDQFRGLEENQDKTKAKLKSEFMQSRSFLKLSEGLTWVVKDGCEIRNVYFNDPEMKSIKAWGGMDAATKTIRLQVRKLLPEDSKELVPLDNSEPVDFESISDIVDEEIFNKLKDHETEKLNRILSLLEENEYESEAIDMATLSVDWALLANELDVGNSREDIIEYTAEKKSSAIGKIVSEVRKYSGNFNVTFSRNKMSDKRDISGERRGIAPNFIHSLDACHMRLFATAMARNGVTDIWSVHDAFGCHPNHIEDMRYIVNKTFVEVHQADENGRGILSRLFYNLTGKELEVGDMDLSDIAKLVDGELLSKYLVS
ncbi:MAG: hypothetical protein CMA02_05300 [Euryarchaeota archaeon]|nr:hypothetical protein [Euryarchaeota archaeon]